jgi:hypothetical protein
MNTSISAPGQRAPTTWLRAGIPNRHSRTGAVSKHRVFKLAPLIDGRLYKIGHSKRPMKTKPSYDP